MPFPCRRFGRRERWTEVHRTHAGRALCASIVPTVGKRVGHERVLRR